MMGFIVTGYRLSVVGDVCLSGGWNGCDLLEQHDYGYTGPTSDSNREELLVMSTITIELPFLTYQTLEEQARRAGKPTEALTVELIERGLQTPNLDTVATTREVLSQAGRISPLSDALRRKIIPDVPLDQVRAALNQAGGPPLSELIDEQRGAKS